MIIVLSSILPIWLLNHDEFNKRKWAPVLGLIAQPFWLFVAIDSQVWSIAFTTIPFTIVWFQSYNKYWRI